MTTFAPQQPEGGALVEVGVVKGRGLLRMMLSSALPVEGDGLVEVALARGRGHLQRWGHLRLREVLLSGCQVEEGAWVGVNVVRGRGLQSQ